MIANIDSRSHLYCNFAIGSKLNSIIYCAIGARPQDRFSCENTSHSLDDKREYQGIVKWTHWHQPFFSTILYLRLNGSVSSFIPNKDLRQLLLPLFSSSLYILSYSS
jgi:hypothetical protein